MQEGFIRKGSIMQISKIHIKNFRAYKDFGCEFADGVNLVIGDNGTGKDEKLQQDINDILMLNGKLNDDGSLKRDTSTRIVMGRRGAYKNYSNLMKALQKKQVPDTAQG